MVTTIQNHKHTAVDTETVDGKAQLICFPDKSLAFPDSFEEIVQFLLSYKRNNEYQHVWTFNLRFDTEAILKWLPDENIKEIALNEKTEYNGIKVSLLGSKQTTFTQHKNAIHLSDIAQFFEGSLDESAETYLGDCKIDTKVSRKFKTPENNTLNYLSDNLWELESYCKKDASLTARLGELVDKTTEQVFHVTPNRYYSKATVSKYVTLDYIGGQENYPTENNDMRAFSSAAYHGGIFDTWQRGSFDEVTDIDVNSMYPFHQVNLPNWKNGKMYRVSGKDDLKEGDEYGWVMCEFDNPEIPYVTDQREIIEEVIKGESWRFLAANHKIIYPHGTRKQIITLAEYNEMIRLARPCEMLYGFVWRQENGSMYKKPFEWINDAVQKKASYVKDSMPYQTAKIGMNGVYGKTAQKIGRGGLQNYQYASYVTAASRIHVMNLIRENNIEDDVIQIATDGILINGKQEIKNDPTFGAVKVKHYDHALVLGNGMLNLYKDGKMVVSKLRGFTGKQIDVKPFFEAHPTYTKMAYLKKRPLHLGECVKHHKVLSINDINRFEMVKRTLNVNSDRKRKWEYVTFGDLLENQYQGKRLHLDEAEQYLKGIN